MQPVLKISFVNARDRLRKLGAEYAAGDIAALRIVLANLHLAILKLPDEQPTVDDIPEYVDVDLEAWERETSNRLMACYADNHPFAQDEAMLADPSWATLLASDLSDVLGWIVKGLQLLEDVSVADQDASWAIQFQYWNGWGSSLLQAQKGLQLVEVPTAATW
jgi:hypothetical protein